MIDLQAFDIKNLVCQEEVIIAFTTAELIEIGNWITDELNRRAESKEGGDDNE